MMLQVKRKFSCPRRTIPHSKEKKPYKANPHPQPNRSPSPTTAAGPPPEPQRLEASVRSPAEPARGREGVRASSAALCAGRGCRGHCEPVPPRFPGPLICRQSGERPRPASPARDLSPLSFTHLSLAPSTSCEVEQTPVECPLVNLPLSKASRSRWEWS